MIILSCTTAGTNNIGQHCWRLIGRFHDVAYTADYLAELHRVSFKKNKQNLIKQAKHIRFCLMQAREYIEAYQAVSLATKPVQLYYCVMMLALAEVLFKGNGDVSLDRAREEHRHHGLDFRIAGHFSLSSSAIELASSLSASPLVSGQRRKGTFELWHREARELPVCGAQITVFPGGEQRGPAVISAPEDVRLSLVPSGGMSLLDCIHQIPGLRASWNALGTRSKLVRAAVKLTRRSERTRQEIQVVIHPSSRENLENLYRLMLFDHHVFGRHSDWFDFVELGSGGILTFVDDEESILKAFPHAVNLNEDDVYFFTQNPCLNEFGFIYLAMFIAGNFARYYPDHWMHLIETSNPLAMAIDEMMNCAEHRVPLLALSEYSRMHYLSPR